LKSEVSKKEDDFLTLQSAESSSTDTACNNVLLFFVKRPGAYRNPGLYRNSCHELRKISFYCVVKLHVGLDARPPCPSTATTFQ
jgi:hypothetical protein